MNLTCVRCEEEFDADNFRGYCDECLGYFQFIREGVHARQRPAPGVIADGKFADGDDGPASVENPITRERCCGVCGSPDIKMGYGLGSGYGMGAYMFCEECYTFLDFSEDRE